MMGVRCVRKKLLQILKLGFDILQNDVVVLVAIIGLWEILIILPTSYLGHIFYFLVDNRFVS